MRKTVLLEMGCFADCCCGSGYTDKDWRDCGENDDWRVKLDLKRRRDCMVCPFCNKEMTKGYIDQTDFRFPLEWYPANKNSGFFVSRRKTVRLSYGGTVKAFRCEDCRKIIIEESVSET